MHDNTHHQDKSSLRQLLSHRLSFTPEAFPVTISGGGAVNANTLQRWECVSGSPDGACQILSHPTAALSSCGWRPAAWLLLREIQRQVTILRTMGKSNERRELCSRPPHRKGELAFRTAWVLLGLRAASNIDNGVLPSILVTGQQPTLPGQLGYNDQLSITPPPSVENRHQLRRLKHSTRTHDTRNVEVARMCHTNYVHRPFSCSAQLEYLLQSVVGEPRRHRLCRQTTTLLRWRDGSSRTGHRRRRQTQGKATWSPWTGYT